VYPYKEVKMPEEKTYEVKDEDKAMLILSYLGILCLVPFFATKPENEYVRWHAKQGLVLFIAEIVLLIVLSIISSILVFAPFVFIIANLLWFFVWIGVIVLCIYCIIQAIKGIKWKIPFLGDFVGKF
jgi:uncharacterized membrane protein